MLAMVSTMCRRFTQLMSIMIMLHLHMMMKNIMYDVNNDYVTFAHDDGKYNDTFAHNDKKYNV